MRSAGGGVLLGITAGHTPIAIDIGLAVCGTIA